jgi:D-alanyl-D-alanine carboxypeptidase (penicillin-binding protein 5/6)
MTTYRRRTARGGAAAVGAAGAVVAALLAPGAVGSAAADVRTAAPVGGAALASPGIVVGPGVPRPPDVADSFVVVDLGTGNVIAAKAAHVRKRPASTLKTLTALTVLPLLDKSTLYVARRADVRVDGTRVGMIEGTTYTVDDLLNAMLLTSANDATSGLVAMVGGNARAVALMTRVAHNLQADDTTVKDPSGLDTPGQYSSAYDLALIGQAAMQRNDFRSYAIKSHAQFPGKPPKVPGQPRPTIPIDNKNGLLMQGYPGMVGVKVGYTSKAGNTYIGEAVRGDRTILVTLMHTHGEAVKAERQLLDWAFANAAAAQPVGVLVQPLSAHPAPTASPSPSAPLVASVAPTSGGSSLVMYAGAVAAVALLGWLTWTVVGNLRRRRLRDNPLGLPPLRGR